MAASEPRARRRRYIRQPIRGLVALTPERQRALQTVGRFGMATVGQLAPLTGVSERSARRTLRVLFDAGYLDVVPLPRTTLLPPGTSDDPSCAFGSGPSLFVLTRAGARLLQELGLVEQPSVLAGRYGPRNSPFIAHELALRDAWVWAERCARQDPAYVLEVWHMGAAAAIELARSQPPRVLRPDAWFRLRLGTAVLVAFLEVDRGSERGGRRWGEKLQAYRAGFEGGRLREVTGFVRGRVLTTTPNERRRDHLAQFVEEHAPAWLAERCYFATQSVLEIPDLYQPCWRLPGCPDLVPLLTRPSSQDSLARPQTGTTPPRERRG